MAAKTLQEQIDALNATITKATVARNALVQKQETESKLAGLKGGDRIVFQYGRAESKFKATGTVVGVQDTEKGKRIRVTYGEGMDSNVVTITLADVQHVYSDVADPVVMDTTQQSVASPNGDLSGVQ